MDLRQFRHAVSLLKKQGLLPERASSGFPLDARSVTPRWKINGRTLGSIVSKYDDIVSGKATALPVPEAKLKQFRKAGFETSQGRVIVSHGATEKARIIAGEVTIENKSGIQRVQIPVEFHNLQQYLRDIRKQSEAINRLKGRNEYFGIRFYGGQRANFYSTIQQLLNDLGKYEAFTTKTARPKQLEIYRNLEIVRITPKAALGIEAKVETRKRVMSKEYNRKHAKKYRESLKKRPATRKMVQTKNAERQRKQRAKLTGKALVAFRKKERLRMKKYRAKLKHRR